MFTKPAGQGSFHTKGNGKEKGLRVLRLFWTDAQLILFLFGLIIQKPNLVLLLLLDTVLEEDNLEQYASQ